MVPNGSERKHQHLFFEILVMEVHALAPRVQHHSLSKHIAWMSSQLYSISELKSRSQAVSALCLVREAFPGVLGAAENVIVLTIRLHLTAC